MGCVKYTSESGSFPNSSSNQLERSGADFLSGRGHAHNSRHAPTFVARLQRLTHGVHVANALESVVETAVGQFDQHFLQRFFVVFGIDELGETELFRCKNVVSMSIERWGVLKQTNFKFGGVNVDPNDTGSSS